MMKDLKINGFLNRYDATGEQFQRLCGLEMEIMKGDFFQSII